MKRVILIFTLALFAVGMAIPPTILAEYNSNKAVAIDRDTQAAEGHSGGLSKSFSPKRTWGESLRHLFGRYFISRLPGTGIIAIGISGTDDDGPLQSQYPPGWKGKFYDRREMDEDPWEELK